MSLFLRHSRLKPLSIPPTTQVFAFVPARSWQDPNISIIPLLRELPISMPEPKNTITTIWRCGYYRSCIAGVFGLSWIFVKESRGFDSDLESSLTDWIYVSVRSIIYVTVAYFGHI